MTRQRTSRQWMSKPKKPAACTHVWEAWGSDARFVRCMACNVIKERAKVGHRWVFVNEDLKHSGRDMKRRLERGEMGIGQLGMWDAPAQGDAEGDDTDE